MPKKVQEAAAERAARAPAVKRAQGEPILPSFRSLIVRVVFAAAMFYLMIVWIFKDSAANAALQAIILAAVMLPMYWLLDRAVYKRRLRRWQAAQAAKK